jgi:hypothetical protein
MYRIDQIIHPVKTPDQGGFATSRGSDQGGHFISGDLHGDIIECQLGSIPEVQMLCFQDKIGCCQWVHHEVVF